MQMKVLLQLLYMVTLYGLPLPYFCTPILQLLGGYSGVFKFIFVGPDTLWTVLLSFNP